jgi:hypothetical protein
MHLPDSGSRIRKLRDTPGKTGACDIERRRNSKRTRWHQRFRSELTIDNSLLGWQRHRQSSEADANQYSVRRSGRSRCQYPGQPMAIVCAIGTGESPSQCPGFDAKRALNAAFAALCFCAENRV